MSDFSRGGGMVDTRALRARGRITREGSSPSLGTTRLITVLIFRGVAQLVARFVWDEEAPGSNPGTPTKRVVTNTSSYIPYRQNSSLSNNPWWDIQEARCQTLIKNPV